MLLNAFSARWTSSHANRIRRGKGRTDRAAIPPIVESLESRQLLTAAFATDQLLIQFAPEAGEAQRAEVRARLGASLAERIHTPAMQSAGAGVLEVVALPPGLAVAKAAGGLNGNPFVNFAEPNWILTKQATSNDAYYTNGSLWGTYGDASSPANPYGSQAAEAWAAGNVGSKGVYVGVIDEGIDFSHPDLAANIWVNPLDQAGDGIDNDGNGYVDDLRGWDFYENNNSIYDGSPTDGRTDSHGTHVTGTIGAVGGNGTGVAGMAWEVTIISGKFLGPNGGYLSDAVQAIDYFTDLKVRHGLNVVATNNSWGGGGFSQAMLDAITRAARQNILFVGAAGNGGSDGSGDNNDSAASYPSNYDTTAGAGYDSVIAVAAIDKNGSLASFSNYGARTVDLGAPGVGVWSTLPNGGYGAYSGTSMATPHVTGAIALYAAANPGASAESIRDAVFSSVLPTSSVSGQTATGGRLNAGGFATALPIVSIADVSIAEGSSGTASAVFTVTLSKASAESIAVNYATMNGTAVASSDYASVSGTLSFAPGETSKTIAVPVYGDLLLEQDETFFVDLSGAMNANIADGRGIGTIKDDDAVGDSNHVYVSDMTWTSGFERKEKHWTDVTIAIRRDADADGLGGTSDSGDEALAGASVTILLIHDSNGDGIFGGRDRSWSGTVMTGSDGVATLRLSKGPSSGNFKAMVTGLAHSANAAYTWNSRLDGENPDYYARGDREYTPSRPRATASIAGSTDWTALRSSRSLTLSAQARSGAAPLNRVSATEHATRPVGSTGGRQDEQSPQSLVEPVALHATIDDLFEALGSELADVTLASL